MKKCPFCGGEIQDAAIKCKHCRRILNTEANPTAPEPAPFSKPDISSSPQNTPDGTAACVSPESPQSNLNFNPVYLIIDDQQRGPFEPEQLQAMWNAGTITPQTMAWRDGLPEWVAFCQLAKTAGIYCTPPPLPANLDKSASSERTPTEIKQRQSSTSRTGTAVLVLCIGAIIVLASVFLQRKRAENIILPIHVQTTNVSAPEQTPPISNISEHQQDKTEKTDYCAKAGESPGEVVVMNNKTGTIAFRLTGNGELDEIGNVSNFLISNDGTLISYSAGTSSLGTEIRLFLLKPDGTAQQLSVPFPPLDLSNVSHMYQTPVRFNQGKLLYTISRDHNISYCAYDIATRKTSIVDESAMTEASPESSVKPEELFKIPKTDLGDQLKKAEAGDAYSQAVLGIKYSLGDGIPIDFQKAVKYSNAASAQGNAIGTYNLARLYEDGQGVAKDANRASELYAKAAPELKKMAQAGDPYAQMLFGVCLEDGQGVEKNEQEAVQWYRKAAEQGNAGGQVKLGICLDRGKGVVKNEQEAVQWYRKAAEQGNANGQINLGACLATGEGVEKNEREAVQWYQKAAEQGVALAQFDLGIRLAYGEGVEKNEQEAVQWFRKAAEQGNADAQRNLGECLAGGKGVEKDKREAVQWFRKAAEQGDDVAQFRLGLCLATGWGVEKNEQEAVGWYRKAAEQGNVDGQERLGSCLVRGIGGDKNEKEGAQWLRRAAEQGLDAAQTNLGLCLEAGIGVEKNKQKAVKWYRKSAEQGDAIGQFNLGVCLAHGEGVEKNEKEAVQWFRKAAEQGNADGQVCLGECLAKGKGAEKNKQEAVQWYRKAAEQGDAVAQFNLGECLENGEGVEKNEKDADYWLKRAAKNGNKDAEKRIQQRALLYDIRLSSPGAPEPEVVINLLNDLIQENPSAREGVPGRDEQNNYQIGVVDNDIVSVFKINEYIRTIDGEKIYFVDIRVAVNDNGTSKIGTASCAFVKRGRFWYPYSYNGKRFSY